MPSSLSTASSSRIRQRRKVSFANTALMVHVLHINDYSDQEHEATFYCVDDFRSFRQDVKDTIRYMEEQQQEQEVMINEDCQNEHEQEEEELQTRYCYQDQAMIVS